MFVGSIPKALRSLIHDAAASWDCSDVYIGCSGNFTIERVLAGERFRLHSNEVSLYSCMAGRYFTGEDLEIGISEDYPDWAWLAAYLTTPAAKLATLMLATDAMVGLGNPNPYYQRQRQAWRAAWPAKHETTMAKLPALHLTSFTAGDVMDFAAAGDRGGAFVSFPPNYKGGYERLYRNLGRVFTWDPPTYTIFDEEATHRLLAIAQEYRYWLLLGEPGLAAPLVAQVQVTNRALPFHIYGNCGPLRLVQPHQHLESLSNPPLGLGDKIDGRLWLAKLSEGQFNFLRSRYMDPSIPPAQVEIALALMNGDRVLGAFAANHMDPQSKRDLMSAYLMSDFPVAPTDYPRLSKLVLMAALSREAQQLMQRSIRFPVYELWTTAFAKRPVSMKYRGLFRLHRRRERPDPEHPYQLEYRARAGQWSLQEALTQWQAA